MARYVYSLPVATNLFEAAVWHKALKVTCQCGHAVTFNLHGLWWLFERKGWDMRLGQARGHFYCKLCTVQRRVPIRPISLNTVQGPGDIILPMPPEREWKSALSRFR